MSKDAYLNKLVTEKETSRKIVKEILSFGVNENQKLDIIYLIALSLENNTALKAITKIADEYRTSVKEDSDDKNKNKKSKILI